MTKHDWFDQLAPLSHTERAAKLGVLREIDARLADELASLLAHDEIVPSTFRLGDLGAALSVAIQAKTEVPNFKLISLLGQGGMGEVWRAERTVAGVLQPVALKLLRLEENSAELHERFIQEQRTLLKLTHPNIARLLDAGTADDGRPWIAMELIEGTSIRGRLRKRKIKHVKPLAAVVAA